MCLLNRSCMYRVIRKSLCTWWLQYRKTRKNIFKKFQSLTIITLLELGITDGVSVSLVSLGLSGRLPSSRVDTNVCCIPDTCGQCLLFIWTYSDNVFCLSGHIRTMSSVYLDIFGQVFFLYGHIQTCLLFIWTYSDNVFCLSGHIRTMSSVYPDTCGQSLLFIWTYADNFCCLSGHMRTICSVYLDIFEQYLMFIRTYANNVCCLSGHMRTSSVYPDICGQYCCLSGQMQTTPSLSPDISGRVLCFRTYVLCNQTVADSVSCTAGHAVVLCVRPNSSSNQHDETRS
jgi:hypothetical protein